MSGHRWAAVLIAAGLVPASARGECPADPSGAVRGAIATMETSFLALDDAGFTTARADLDAALPCVDVPLEKRDALALHRAMGLALFVDGDMRGSQKAWGAVKALRPEWQLTPDMAPDGTLLRQIFDKATPESAVVTLSLTPKNGWLVDGTWTSDVPADRAFALQALGDDGVYYTGYQLSVAGIPLTDLVQPGPSARSRRARTVGTGVAAVLGAGSLGALGVYLQARGAVDEVPYPRVAPTAHRANVAGGLAIGLGAAAVGTFAVAWAVPW